MKVGSLFSGIGGLDLGLERAGMEVVWQCENDPYASRVLAKHWPDVPNLGDITEVDWNEIPRVDLVCGGFPCQDISVAGNGVGLLKGTRSVLWLEFERCLRALRPRWALVENSSALVVRGFERILADLAALGYDAWWDGIPAAAVGARHQRDRTWVVAHADEPRLEGRRERPVRAGPVARGGAGADVAYAVSVGRARRPDGPGAPKGAGPCRESQGSRLDGWWGWLAEPDVGRVAHGVPARVDRLRCLGNAVVPQVAELIGRAIVEADRQVAA